MAILSALLYLIVADLSVLQTMYQFSLEYFNKIFKNVLINTPSFEDSVQRV